VREQRQRRARQRLLRRQLATRVSAVRLTGGRSAGQRDDRNRDYVVTTAPWHFLYFLPLPQGHGSFRPTFGSLRRTVFGSPFPLPLPLPAALACASLPPP